MKKSENRSSLILLSFYFLLIFSSAAVITATYTPISSDIHSAGNKYDNNRVFKVLPSSDTSGIEDTINIQKAFDSATTAGPGSIVQLESGLFYISKSIIVVNFNGIFKGSGKYQTIIQNTEECDFPIVTSEELPYFNGIPSLFFFYYEEPLQNNPSNPFSLKCSDFTIHIKGDSELWYHGLGQPSYSLNAITVLGKCTDIEDFETTYMNSYFERIEIDGEYTDKTASPNSNINCGILFECNPIYTVEEGIVLFKYVKRISGICSIIDCSFNDVRFPCSLYGYQDSRIKVKNNDFNKVSYGIEIVDASNTNIEISQNNIKNVRGVGIIIEQGIQALAGLNLGPVPELMPESSSAIINCNNIQCINPGDGIGIVDYCPFAVGKRLDVYILYNKVILDNTGYGGIVSYFAEDAMAIRNKIMGTGMAGIYGFLNGWKILFNDVSDLKAAVAPIWLWAGTKNCLVIGFHTDTTVLDDTDDPTTPEYDGNNCIINLK